MTNDEQLKNETPKAVMENEKFKKALHKINDIRNSIIGYQKINWSAHIYPLVAALNEAGFEGEGYEKSRLMAKTQLDRISDLEAQLVKAKELLFNANGFIPFYQFELKQEIESFLPTNEVKE